MGKTGPHVEPRKASERIIEHPSKLLTPGDLEAVAKRKEEFAEESLKRKRTPLKLADIPVNGVRLISLGELAITLVLPDDQRVEFKYESAEALAQDLEAWTKSETPPGFTQSESIVRADDSIKSPVG